MKLFPWCPGGGKNGISSSAPREYSPHANSIGSRGGGGGEELTGLGSGARKKKVPSPPRSSGAPASPPTPLRAPYPCTGPARGAPRALSPPPPPNPAPIPCPAAAAGPGREPRPFQPSPPPPPCLAACSGTDFRSAREEPAHPPPLVRPPWLANPSSLCSLLSPSWLCSTICRWSRSPRSGLKQNVPGLMKTKSGGCAVPSPPPPPTAVLCSLLSPLNGELT